MSEDTENSSTKNDLVGIHDMVLEKRHYFQSPLLWEKIEQLMLAFKDVPENDEGAIDKAESP